MPPPTISKKLRRLISQPWNIATIRTDFLAMEERSDSLWARDKVKAYAHSEIREQVVACMVSHFETLVATHPAPYQDATAPEALQENREHASTFQTLLLGSVRKSIAAGIAPPPLEWLQGWLQHAYAVGGNPRLLEYVACSQYPEGVRLEWLRRAMIASREKLSLKDPTTAAILAVPIFNATILMHRLLSLKHFRHRSVARVVEKPLFPRHLGNIPRSGYRTLCADAHPVLGDDYAHGPGFRSSTCSRIW